MSITLGSTEYFKGIGKIAFEGPKSDNPLAFKWYGAFNVLDGYVPDQRRIAYTRQTGTQNPYRLFLPKAQVLRLRSHNPNRHNRCC